MNNPILASKEKCTGCMACADSCQKANAISITVGSDGHYYPKVDTKKCVGCKLCEKSCPIVSNLNYGFSPLHKAFAAWNNDTTQRRQSASGGVFSAMASKVIDEGGVVFGAALQDICSVKHIKVVAKEDLYKLQGSKYTQSNTCGIYNEVYQCLKNEQLVLFSGTGCQIAGLFSFLGKRRYSGRLITVDLICGGISSKLLIDKFIENEPYKIKRVVSFRTKENGWKPVGFRYNLKTEDIDGGIHDYTGIRNLLTDGFSSELTNRYSCYDCNFAGLNRMSDFTIGDLWGDTQYPDQHYDGLSIIIAHNQESLNWLEDAKNYISTSDVDLEKAVSINFRLLECHDPKKNYWERTKLEDIFSNYSYKTIKKIYALDFSNTSIWMLYKIYRVVRNKIQR